MHYIQLFVSQLGGIPKGESESERGRSEAAGDRFAVADTQGGDRERRDCRQTSGIFPAYLCTSFCQAPIFRRARFSNYSLRCAYK